MYLLNIMMHPSIYVGKTEAKGNGMFTLKALAENTIIEESPVIVMSAEERLLLDKTLLHDYIFEWEPDGQQLCCMAQGYISVYNHSKTANCEYFMDYDNETMMVKTIRAVAANEELLVNYNGDWDNKDDVWFDMK